MSCVDDFRLEFKNLNSLTALKDFLDCRALKHKNYYHYTNIRALKSMLRSKMLYLSLGKKMNDLLEIKKIAPERWERLYVASFSFGSNESVALWHIYGNPLDTAIRIQFSKKSILDVLAQLRIDMKCRAVCPSNCHCNIKTASLVDIAYIHNNQKSVRWNKAILSANICPEIELIQQESCLAGYIKNIAWEYESETRLLVELSKDNRMDKFPDRIQICAEKLWNGAKILCGPCLSPHKFKNEMQEFYEDYPSAIRLNIEDEKK